MASRSDSGRPGRGARAASRRASIWGRTWARNSLNIGPVEGSGASSTYLGRQPNGDDSSNGENGGMGKRPHPKLQSEAGRGEGGPPRMAIKPRVRGHGGGPL